jgi:hypothetical protein
MQPEKLELLYHHAESPRNDFIINLLLEYLDLGGGNVKWHSESSPGVLYTVFVDKGVSQLLNLTNNICQVMLVVLEVIFELLITSFTPGGYNVAEMRML